jgi:Tfp pilus assembly protein PilN
MIKINLLESVTDKQTGAAVAVERKVSSPVSRLLLMAIAVAVMTLAIIGWDVVSTQMAKSASQAELEKQQQKAKELEAVLKEQKDLEQKIANIDSRIEAIKRLRSSQAGPSAVLDSVRERISMVPGLYLESIEQKGDQLTVKGSSPDEAAVTQFGRSLEFSSGLFSNLSIETQRKEVQAAQVATPTTGELNALEVVSFTIRCAYTPGKSGQDGQGTGASPSTAGIPQPITNGNQPTSDGTARPQIAKN